MYRLPAFLIYFKLLRFALVVQSTNLASSNLKMASIPVSDTQGEQALPEFSDFSSQLLDPRTVSVLCTCVADGNVS